MDILYCISVVFIGTRGNLTTPTTERLEPNGVRKYRIGPPALSTGFPADVREVNYIQLYTGNLNSITPICDYQHCCDAVIDPRRI